MSFENLKKQSKLGALTEKLVKEVEKMNSTSNYNDDRFWKPEMGKDSIGSAVIRFLPAPEGEDLPWVKMYSHAFKGPENAWLIENCPTTNGQSCPICKENSKLWNSGVERDKEVARQRKRKLSYYSNIYVVRDPLHPENEGKNFLFKYGKKIFDKIMESMQPEFEDEEPINPFDFWQGANFKLKIVKKDGYWNYDKSEFDRVQPLLDDDDALEAIWKKEYSLSALVSPDQFKSSEELEQRFRTVMNLSSSPTRSRSVMEQEDELEDFEETPTRETKVLEELEESYLRSQTSRDSSAEEEETDDTLEYFKSLIDED